MTEVILHIYDVTNSGSEKTNSTIVQINKIFKDGIGLGGIFHSAVQVYGEDEWSFGFCEQGTGVFSCPSGKNPMYTYRECIVLGSTNCSIFKVNQILRELSREWPGSSYDLLAKNCNHFCDEFCERLGVPKLPGWVNRFANAGDAAMEVAGNTALRFRQAKTEIVSASKVAYRFLLGVTSNVGSIASDSPSNSNRGSPGFQATWFKNLITTGAKPSTSTEIENQNENDDLHRQQRRQDAELLLQQNSRHNV
ncbi:deSI-like protein At4g17486 [Carica papaya]|uniref:deSI-like protein At4g17486 n=1 Tax=Carica papaya TaxID=3649 RepID=UPI000B8CEC5B|nr:deSI-like protein At4g17486 [Carica papaya]